MTLFREAEQLRDLEGAVGDVAITRERGEEPAAAPEPRDHGGLERLEHGELGEDVHELKGPRHAEPGEGRRAQAADVALLESDVARGRTEGARQQVDERRLAGAVRPDDRDALALVDGEAHPRERAEVAVELRQITRLEDHGATALIRGRRRRGGPAQRAP